MNQKTETNKTINQNRMMRWLTAVGEKLFNWLCQHEMELSAFESHGFLFYNGLGVEEAAFYQTIAFIKQVTFYS